MTDILLDALLGAAPALPAIRANASAGDDADSKGAFARVMGQLSGKKDQQAQTSDEQPASSPPSLAPAGAAFSLQLFPAPPDGNAEKPRKDCDAKQAEGDAVALAAPNPLPSSLPSEIIKQLAASEPPAMSCEANSDLPPASLPAPDPSKGSPKPSLERSARSAARAAIQPSSQAVLAPILGDEPEQALLIPSTYHEATIQAPSRLERHASGEWEPSLQDASRPDMAQPALPMTIHVNQIQTHFPAMVANALTSLTPTGGIDDDIQIHRPLEAMDKPKDVQKIVSFEVEPASLGAISVRMRMTHSGVDIQIVAENASTSALLTDTRETLSAAIGERGLRLESYEVVLNVAHPVAAATGAEGGAGGADRQPAFAGERGFTHDDRPGQRPRQNANARRRERISPTSGPVGVIL